MTIIALCGYAQSGKDTVAEFMAPLGYKRVAFADPLKELALATNPWFYCPLLPVHFSSWVSLRSIVENRGWERAKAEVPGVREYLQDLGVGVRDILGADTWLNVALDKVSAALDNGQHVVITDARFKNELDAIHNLGGWFVEIVRPGVQPPNQHVSETEWGQWLGEFGADYTITNDGSLDDLKYKVAAARRLLEG